MKSVFHLALLLCLASVLVTEALGQSCCSGWTKHGSRCFRFYDTKKTWIDAEQTCIDNGGNLASVHSTAEQKFLHSLTGKTKTWIGGFDAVKEDEWQWSDGTKVDITFWNTGEPNNLGEEHCMEMNFRGDLWNDQSCTDNRPFVCVNRI